MAQANESASSSSQRHVRFNHSSLPPKNEEKETKEDVDFEASLYSQSESSEGAPFDFHLSMATLLCDSTGMQYLRKFCDRTKRPYVQFWLDVEQFRASKVSLVKRALDIYETYLRTNILGIDDAIKTQLYVRIMAKDVTPFLFAEAQTAVLRNNIMSQVAPAFLESPEYKALVEQLMVDLAHLQQKHQGPSGRQFFYLAPSGQRKRGPALEDLVINPVGVQLFRQFLVGMAHEALLDFYLSVASFQSRVLSSQERTKDAKYIYRRFLHPSSPTCVCSQKSEIKRVRDVITHTPGGPPVDVFDRVQRVVWKRLIRDLYPLLLSSTMYAETLEYTLRTFSRKPTQNVPEPEEAAPPPPPPTTAQAPVYAWVGSSTAANETKEEQTDADTTAGGVYAALPPANTADNSDDSAEFVTVPTKKRTTKRQGSSRYGFRSKSAGKARSHKVARMALRRGRNRQPKSSLKTKRSSSAKTKSTSKSAPNTVSWGPSKESLFFSPRSGKKFSVEPPRQRLTPRTPAAKPAPRKLPSYRKPNYSPREFSKVVPDIVEPKGSLAAAASSTSPPLPPPPGTHSTTTTTTTGSTSSLRGRRAKATRLARKNAVKRSKSSGKAGSSSNNSSSGSLVRKLKSRLKARKSTKSASRGTGSSLSTMRSTMSSSSSTFSAGVRRVKSHSPALRRVHTVSATSTSSVKKKKKKKKKKGLPKKTKKSGIGRPSVMRTQSVPVGGRSRIPAPFRSSSDDTEPSASKRSHVKRANTVMLGSRDRRKGRRPHSDDSAPRTPERVPQHKRVLSIDTDDEKWTPPPAEPRMISMAGLKGGPRGQKLAIIDEMITNSHGRLSAPSSDDEDDDNKEPPPPPSSQLLPRSAATKRRPSDSSPEARVEEVSTTYRGTLWTVTTPDGLWVRRAPYDHAIPVAIKDKGAVVVELARKGDWIKHATGWSMVMDPRHGKLFARSKAPITDRLSDAFNHLADAQHQAHISPWVREETRRSLVQAASAPEDEPRRSHSPLHSSSTASLPSSSSSESVSVHDITRYRMSRLATVEAFPPQRPIGLGKTIKAGHLNMLQKGGFLSRWQYLYWTLKEHALISHEELGGPVFETIPLRDILHVRIVSGKNKGRRLQVACSDERDLVLVADSVKQAREWAMALSKSLLLEEVGVAKPANGSSSPRVVPRVHTRRASMSALESMAVSAALAQESAGGGVQRTNSRGRKHHIQMYSSSSSAASAAAAVERKSHSQLRSSGSFEHLSDMSPSTTFDDLTTQLSPKKKAQNVSAMHTHSGRLLRSQSSPDRICFPHIRDSTIALSTTPSDPPALRVISALQHSFLLAIKGGRHASYHRAAFENLVLPAARSEGNTVRLLLETLLVPSREFHREPVKKNVHDARRQQRARSLSASEWSARGPTPPDEVMALRETVFLWCWSPECMEGLIDLLTRDANMISFVLRCLFLLDMVITQRRRKHTCSQAVFLKQLHHLYQMAYGSQSYGSHWSGPLFRDLVLKAEKAAVSEAKQITAPPDTAANSADTNGASDAKTNSHSTDSEPSQNGKHHTRSDSRTGPARGKLHRSRSKASHRRSKSSGAREAAARSREAEVKAIARMRASRSNLHAFAAAAFGNTAKTGRAGKTGKGKHRRSRSRPEHRRKGSQWRAHSQGSKAHLFEPNMEEDDAADKKAAKKKGKKKSKKKKKQTSGSSATPAAQTQLPAAEEEEEKENKKDDDDSDDENAQCSACAHASGLFVRHILNPCGGLRFTHRVRKGLLFALLTPIKDWYTSQDSMAVFSHSVVNPSVWKALFQCMAGSPIPIRLKTLEDIEALLVRSDENRDSLGSQEAWQEWVVGAVAEVPVNYPDRPVAERRVMNYMLHICVLLCVRALFTAQPAVFEAMFNRTVHAFQLTWPQASQHTWVVHKFLKALMSEVALRRDNFPDYDRGHTSWTNLVLFLRMLKVYAFQTPSDMQAFDASTEITPSTGLIDKLFGRGLTKLLSWGSKPSRHDLSSKSAVAAVPANLNSLQPSNSSPDIRLDEPESSNPRFGDTILFGLHIQDGKCSDIDLMKKACDLLKRLSVGDIKEYVRYRDVPDKDQAFLEKFEDEVDFFRLSHEFMEIMDAVSAELRPREIARYTEQFVCCDTKRRSKFLKQMQQEPELRPLLQAYRAEQARLLAEKKEKERQEDLERRRRMLEHSAKRRNSIYDKAKASVERTASLSSNSSTRGSSARGRSPVLRIRSRHTSPPPR